MASVETCEVCGFAWDEIPAAATAPRTTAAVESLAARLRAHPEVAVERPAPTRWSMLEYGAHVRDVLLNLRDRILLGAIEDNPTPKAMHRDERVELGCYAADTPEVVADELELAAGLFARTLAVLSPDLLSRPIVCGWPVATTRSLRWLAAQALHEVEHHLADVEENYAVLQR